MPKAYKVCINRNLYFFITVIKLKTTTSNTKLR